MVEQIEVENNVPIEVGWVANTTEAEHKGETTRVLGDTSDSAEEQRDYCVVSTSAAVMYCYDDASSDDVYDGDAWTSG